MTETVTIDRPSVAKPVSRSRSRKPATVSVSALALHLDCSRTYIGKLEEGVIQRQGGGFPLDQRRAAYLRFLRRERRQSPRMEADADHVKGQDRDAATAPDGEEARAGADGRSQRDDRQHDGRGADGDVQYAHAARRAVIWRPAAPSSGACSRSEPRSPTWRSRRRTNTASLY